MKTSIITKIMLLLLVPAVLAFSADPAEAQRREKREKVEEKEPLFPNATRKEPGLNASSRFQRDMQRGYEAAQKENFELSLQLADKVIGDSRAGPFERAVSQQNAAFALMEQDRYVEAAERIEKAIEDDALNNDTHYQLMAQLAQIQMQEENHAESLKWVERLLAETRSERDDYHVLKANALFRLDRFQEAVGVLNQLLARSTDPQPVWTQLIIAAYMEMEQPLDAARVAEAQLQRTPEDKQLLMNLASMYVEADSYEKAAETLSLARSRNLLSEDRDYRQLYRLYLNIDGQEAAAIEVINEGMEKQILNPNLEVYNILGQAYYFSDRIPEAITAWQKADELAEDGEVALNLSRVFYNEERYSEAMAAARRAMEKGVKRVGEAWIIIGNSEYFGMDNKAGGVSAYREAAKYPETKDQAETWLRQSRNM